MTLSKFIKRLKMLEDSLGDKEIRVCSPTGQFEVPVVRYDWIDPQDQFDHPTNNVRFIYLAAKEEV